MTEREAFEAWAKQPPMEWDCERYTENEAWPDSYRHYPTQCAWEGWQARAQPAQAVPASCGECGKKTSDGWALYCVACMEEAGLPGGTSSPPLTHSCTSSLVRTADSTAQAVPDNELCPSCRNGDIYACTCTAPRAKAEPSLKQALTDPENQPNQYGVEFLMHGPKFAFKVGTQQFTLDYETTEPGEFEFMRDMLIHAFSTFTPDVKTSQAVPLLTRDELHDMRNEARSDVQCMDELWWVLFARRVEQAVRAKMGAAVPMTYMQIVMLWGHRSDGPSTPEIISFARAVERHHGIVGKEGGK